MATRTLLLLLRIWIRKSRAFYAKVRPDKDAGKLFYAATSEDFND